MASASAPRWKLPSSPPWRASSTSSTGSTTVRHWSCPCWQQKARLRLRQGAETLERRTRHEADQGSRDGWDRSTRDHVTSRYQALPRTQVHVGEVPPGSSLAGIFSASCTHHRTGGADG